MTDPPERVKETDDEQARRIMGVDTPEGRDEVDRLLVQAGGSVKRTIEENRYWERIRFKTNKSPRARKRDLEREARRQTKAQRA